MDAYRSLLSERTRLVAVAHVSNVLGTVNPVAEITRLAHEAGALVLIDGAQAIAHTRADVEAIGADFYAFARTRSTARRVSVRSMDVPRCWIACRRTWVGER